MSTHPTTNMQTIAGRAGGPLPHPRFLFKQGQVIDRWKGKQYDARPVVLVSVLNRLVAEGGQDVDTETARRLVERAEAVERLIEQRDGAKQLLRSNMAKLELDLATWKARHDALLTRLEKLKALAHSGNIPQLHAELTRRDAPTENNPFAGGL